MRIDRRAKRGLVSRQGDQRERSLRVVVLTAEVGEGHVAAARALASDLLAESSDVEVVVCDALVGLGSILRYLLLDAYRWQLRRAPWIFGLLYRTFAAAAPLRGLGRAALALLGARRLLRLVQSYRPDVVVSTYPAATSVLGHLRRRGRLSVPAYATATDFAGLEFWAHPGIDLHLVMHESCLAPVERVAGRGSARLVRPLVSPAFFAPRSRDQARRALGLASCNRLVVVSGGGWGVGNLQGAVAAVLELPATTVVCLTGRDDTLRTRLSKAFADEARVRVFGFTEQMSDLLAAADALVHSTGGVTCLEALACGCPIVAYGAPPGHAPLTARAMASLGLLQCAHSRSELAPALRHAFTRSEAKQPQLPPAPSAASLILAAQARPQRAALWNARGLRASVAVAGALVLGGWALLSDDAFPVVARALDLEPVSALATVLPEVGLVIRAPRQLVPDLLSVLNRRSAHASFAFARAPGGLRLRALSLSGNDALPELGRGGLTHWLDTRDEVKRKAHEVGLSSDSFYLAPPSGFTAMQDLLSRDSGARPILGSAQIGPAGSGATDSFQPGEIVVLTLGLRPQVSASVLDRLLGAFARQGLRAVSFGELLASTRPRPRSL